MTKETVRAVIDLDVAEDQNQFVAPNAWSISEAYFEPKAWFRAIYADDEPVGFLMLYDDPATPRYYLWRMMVAADHQRKGYGTRSLDLLVEYVRGRPNATEILVGAVPGEGSPMAFYQRYGFADTGKVEHGEVLLRLEL